MDKIAITGPRGRLGSELVRRGCIPIEANVTDFYSLNQAILEIKPDVVIHCAAKTNVDACETQAIDAMLVNAGGTYGLAQVFSGKIVYISTDYVFDGEDGPYDEEDKPNPISIYGWSKLGGEIALNNRHNPDDLIIRTTVLFDRYSRNFVTAVIEQLLASQIIKLPDQLFGTPTYIPHLAEGILKAIELNISGILNVAGGETMSRFSFAHQIADVLNLTHQNIQPGPVLGRAPRPLKAGLITTKAIAFNIPIYHPMDGIREIVNALETMAAG